MSAAVKSGCSHSDSPRLMYSHIGTVSNVCMCVWIKGWSPVEVKWNGFCLPLRVREWKKEEKREKDTEIWKERWWWGREANDSYVSPWCWDSPTRAKNKHNFKTLKSLFFSGDKYNIFEIILNPISLLLYLRLSSQNWSVTTRSKFSKSSRKRPSC